MDRQPTRPAKLPIGVTRRQSVLAVITFSYSRRALSTQVTEIVSALEQGPDVLLPGLQWSAAGGDRDLAGAQRTNWRCAVPDMWGESRRPDPSCSE